MHIGASVLFDMSLALLNESRSAGCGAEWKSMFSSIHCWAGVRRIYAALGTFVWGQCLA